MREPIVTPLVDRLSWTAWLKPFFIHPSVTAGAKKNMKNVRAVQEQLAAERKENADTAKINAALKAINKVVNPAVAFDFEADTPVIEEIQHSLLNLLPVVEAPKAGEVAVDPREPSLYELTTGLEGIFLRALNIRNEAAKKSLLDAIAKANPKYKAFIEILAINELPANEHADALYYVRQALNGKHLNFDAKLKAIYTAIEGIHKDDPTKAPLLAAAKALKPEEAKVNSDVREVLPYVSLESKWSIVKGAFWKAVGFHGYDSTSTVITTSHGQKFYFKDSNRWHTLAAFMGLPTRVDSVDTLAVYDGRQFVRDLFGGWESLYNRNSKGNKLSETSFWMVNPYNYTFEGKRLWNTLLLPVKFVIAAYYLVTFPVKAAINLVRQVTEVLPQSLLQYSGWFYGESASALLDIHYADVPLRGKIIPGAKQAVLLIVSFAVHHVARLWALVGTAGTSPQQSARDAWKYGLALNSRFGIVFATLGALSSIALTAVIWALTFPVLFAKALIVFPALTPIVTSISQLPIVASTLQVVSGSATIVAGTLPAAFSAAATAISTAFGVTVSATTLAVAVTWAIIAAPVAAIATASANGLSNAWTRWKASWTLVEAASRAVADVTISVQTTFLQLLPSEKVTEIANAFEKTYYGSVESEQLLAATQKETRDGKFNTYKEPLHTLEFPVPVARSTGRGF